LPTPLFELSLNTKALATLEEVEFEFRQFPKGHNVDQAPASMASVSPLREWSCAVTMQSLICWIP
jgi:hypothetical protein